MGVPTAGSPEEGNVQGTPNITPEALAVPNTSIFHKAYMEPRGMKYPDHREMLLQIKALVDNAQIPCFFIHRIDQPDHIFLIADFDSISQWVGFKYMYEELPHESPVTEMPFSTDEINFIVGGNRPVQPRYNISGTPQFFKLVQVSCKPGLGKIFAQVMDRKINEHYPMWRVSVCMEYINKDKIFMFYPSHVDGLDDMDDPLVYPGVSVTGLVKTIDAWLWKYLDLSLDPSSESSLGSGESSGESFLTQVNEAHYESEGSLGSGESSGESFLTQVNEAD